jgi:hypothetical protein
MKNLDPDSNERKPTKAYLLRQLAAANTAAAAAARALADLEERETGDEYYDQTTSPLGHKGHLRGAAEGKFPSFRRGKKVLVKRTEMHAFIESAPRHPKVVPTVSKRSNADDLRDELGLEGGAR